MKYDVIQNADGNTSIVSTWVDNLNGAKQAFCRTSANLYADPETIKATVAIFDEQLNIVDNMKQFIDKTVPAPVIYTVAFNSHGGSEVESQEIPYGGTVTIPEDPVREGYSFTGWELNGYLYNFDGPVYENMVLVATWEKEE